MMLMGKRKGMEKAITIFAVIVLALLVGAVMVTFFLGVLQEYERRAG